MTLAVLAAVVVVPALTAVCCLALGGRLPRTVAPVAVAGGTAGWVAGLWLAVPHLGAASPIGHVFVRMPTGGVPIEVGMHVDALSAVLVLLATSVSLAVQVYSVGYLHGDPRYPSYACIVALFTAAMTLVVVADDLFVLLVGWELMGICSYFLISHHWELPDARAGAVKAFVMTRLGDVGMLFGIFVLGSAAGTYRISAINAAAAGGRLPTVQLTVAMLLVLCGVVGKSAQFPLHTWLPDAMPGPTPISALIHAATMVAAGVFLVARLYPAYEAAPGALAVLAVVASVTMLGAALFALAQDDLKRVLAWSTVSQLAYMFGALAVGGYRAGIFHLLSHGAFKALLFLAAGAVAHAVGSTSMSSMGGLRRSLPTTFVTMTVGFAALAGLVPTGGFFSKDAVLGAALEAARHGGPVAGWLCWLVFGCGLATVVVTAAYSMRAWLRVFFGPSGRPAIAEGGASASPASPVEAPASMLGPMVVLAAATAVGGVLLAWPGLLASAHPADLALVHPLLGVVTTVLVLVSGAVTFGEWWRVDGGDPAVSLGRLRRPLAREFAVDAAYDRSLVGLVSGSSRTVLATDADVVEPYVRGSAASARGLGGLVRLAQTGNIQTYLTVVVAGVALLAVVAGTVGR